MVPSSGRFFQNLTYQVLNGEIHPQHLHETLSSPCLNVIVCQFQSANMHIRLKTKNLSDVLY